MLQDHQEKDLGIKEKDIGIKEQDIGIKKDIHLLLTIIHPLLPQGDFLKNIRIIEDHPLGDSYPILLRE